MSQVDELLARAARLPYGPTRVALLDEAVGIADSLGDVDLALRAREAMTDSAGLSNEPLKGLAAFTWRLGVYDREPQRFDDEALWGLLWDLKKMAAFVINRPDVPAERVEQVLDEMRDRYAAYGQGARSHAMFRWEWAWERGHTDEAERLLEVWQGLPRDNLSHCQACEPSLVAEYLVETGRHERAIEVARPVLDAEFTCFDEPENTRAALALSMARLGRAAEAAAAHRRSYRAIRGRLEYAGIVHHHLTFLALTGNEVRGLEVLEENLRWLAELRKPGQLLELAGAAALLLRRVATTMSPETLVRVPAGLMDAAGQVPAGQILPGVEVPAGEMPAGQVPVALLGQQLEATARAVAAQFDARNGTDHTSRLLTARLDSAPVTEHLPLAVTAAPAPPAARTTPVAAEPSAEAAAAAGPGDAPTAGGLDAPASAGGAVAAGPGYEMCTELDNALLTSILDAEELRYEVDADGSLAVPFEDGPVIYLSVVGSDGDTLMLRAYYLRAFDDADLPRLRELVHEWHSSTFQPKLYPVRDPEGRLRVCGETVERCAGGRTRANLAYAIAAFISAALQAQHALEGTRNG